MTALLLLGVGCGGGAAGGQGLSGSIKIDGSSTVFPITEAMAEEFMLEHRQVRITVGISGTGGGFEKFCRGETDISDASRAIRDSEKQKCTAKGIEPVEFKVAYDGLAVMVHKSNSFVTCLTTAELKKIWEPAAQGIITRWNQVRPQWPDEPIKLYGPGTDSGTFDYFTEAINGKEDASRGDYTASEDDNVLVQGIAGDKDSLGYFGMAYYEENQSKLKLVAVDGGNGCVLPNRQTVESGTYKPLSRPLFIYVRKDALQRPETKEFMRFYLTEGVPLVSEVGYIPLPQSEYNQGLQTLQAASVQR